MERRETKLVRVSDADHLREAIRLAVESAESGGGPFGAVVVCAGAVVASGTNRVIADGDPTAHAEVVAIRAACAALGGHALVGATLYASCEPCPMCFAAAHWARVERVVYACDRGDAAAAGFDDDHLHAEVARAPGERALACEQQLADEGLAAFRAWAANDARTPY